MMRSKIGNGELAQSGVCWSEGRICSLYLRKGMRLRYVEPCRFSRSGSKSETSTQQVLKVADAEILEDDRIV